MSLERIRSEVLQDGRGEYGERIVSALSTQLVADYGKGFAEKSLRRMVQFADIFQTKQLSRHCRDN